MKKNKFLIIFFIGLFIIVAFLIFWQKNDSSSVEAKITNDLSNIPKNSQLKANMRAAGLDVLENEGFAVHTHQHFDIIINNKNIIIPADIGIGFGFISPLHTHDEENILHVESPVVKDFTLGQFFREWGVDLNDNCIGSYCADENNKLIVAVNGNTLSQPQNHVLKAYDQIFIWYGNKNENPNIIASYSFPKGL